MNGSSSVRNRIVVSLFHSPIRVRHAQESRRTFGGLPINPFALTVLLIAGRGVVRHGASGPKTVLSHTDRDGRDVSFTAGFLSCPWRRDAQKGI